MALLLCGPQKACCEGAWTLFGSLPGLSLQMPVALLSRMLTTQSNVMTPGITALSLGGRSKMTPLESCQPDTLGSKEPKL